MKRRLNPLLHHFQSLVMGCDCCGLVQIAEGQRMAPAVAGSESAKLPKAKSGER